MSGSGRIQLLADTVINKIAAGEVVERPASVVKELLENAIDAAAEAIEVEVVSGGKRLISIQDDGHGMSRDDALMALERHATSKIHDVHDIERIGTLGFRGEALAAIASVSRFSLLTREVDALEGTEIDIQGGSVQSVQGAGGPAGTRVTVRNLFFNVPARRKFLRTEQTEFGHIRQMFLVHALAHPDLALRLTADDRLIYEMAGGATLADRIRELFSAELLRSLKEVDYADADVHVSGYVGQPQLHRADRSEQYVFVNGRPAGAPVIGRAIREAYQSLMAKSRHPVIFLFIETDPDRVDVNVHPTKKEVRFRNPSEVKAGIYEAIVQALKGEGKQTVQDPSEVPPHLFPPQPVVEIQDLPRLDPFPYPRLPLGGDPLKTPGGAPGTFYRAGGAPDAPGAGAPWSWCRVLGQVGGLYVVLETDEGLVLMDPHAAHERVLFEGYMGELGRHEVRSQGMLVPEAVELSPVKGTVIRANIGILQEMGFGISEFGGNSFLVDAIPSCLGEVSAASLLPEIAVFLEENGTRSGTQILVEEEIARQASRAAVQGRRLLKLKEIEHLVVELARTDMPYTCPHGRPTIIFMGYGELDRKFGRV